MRGGQRGEIGTRAIVVCDGSGFIINDGINLRKVMARAQGQATIRMAVITRKAMEGL